MDRIAKSPIILAVALTAGAVAPGQAMAQQEAGGKDQVVDGSVLNPGATEPLVLNFNCSGAGEDLAGAITVPGVEALRMDLRDVVVTTDRFMFVYTSPDGTEIECTLLEEGGEGFRGECMAGMDSIEMAVGVFEH